MSSWERSGPPWGSQDEPAGQPAEQRYQQHPGNDGAQPQAGGYYGGQGYDYGATQDYSGYQANQTADTPWSAGSAQPQQRDGFGQQDGYGPGEGDPGFQLGRRPTGFRRGSFAPAGYGPGGSEQPPPGYDQAAYGQAGYSQAGYPHGDGYGQDQAYGPGGYGPGGYGPGGNGPGGNGPGGNGQDANPAGYPQNGYGQAAYGQPAYGQDAYDQPGAHGGPSGYGPGAYGQDAAYGAQAGYQPDASRYGNGTGAYAAAGGYAPVPYGTDQYAPGQYAPGQYDQNQLAQNQLAPGQYGATQLGPGQYDQNQYGTAQYGTEQFAPNQYALNQYALNQYAPNQLGIPNGYDGQAAWGANGVGTEVRIAEPASAPVQRSGKALAGVVFGLLCSVAIAAGAVQLTKSNFGAPAQNTAASTTQSTPQPTTSAKSTTPTTTASGPYKLVAAATAGGYKADKQVPTFQVTAVQAVAGTMKQQVQTTGMGTFTSTVSRGYLVNKHLLAAFTGFNGTFNPDLIAKGFAADATHGATVSPGPHGGIMGCGVVSGGTLCVWVTNKTLAVVEFFSATGAATLPNGTAAAYAMNIRNSVEVPAR
jgi:hypothetical protein